MPRAWTRASSPFSLASGGQVCRIGAQVDVLDLVGVVGDLDPFQIDVAGLVLQSSAKASPCRPAGQTSRAMSRDVAEVFILVLLRVCSMTVLSEPVTASGKRSAENVDHGGRSVRSRTGGQGQGRS